MADHITEEEQIEALKRWWDENGKQVVLAIVLTVGGYFGWQAWTDYVEEKTAAASLVYQEMLDHISLNGLKPICVQLKAQKLFENLPIKMLSFGTYFIASRFTIFLSFLNLL